MPGHPRTRRFAAGAECVEDGVDFCVWADSHERVELAITGRSERLAMRRDKDGYFRLRVEGLSAGARYAYWLDGQGPHPDPASRYQPLGPDGPSEVIDAHAYRWHDGEWRGIELLGQVIYELHVGTFTAEGTFAAASTKLPYLRELGVTAIELMPVAEFASDFGWGYDGVHLYAPHHAYGRPEDLRNFVDGAHRLGMAVILDVVYNHLGPAGNCLPAYSARYFSPRPTDWGACPNYDGPGSRQVRDFICDNAAHWLIEYHVDGFRLDAVQSLFDDSREHIVAELARRARAAVDGRKIIVVAENEPQCAELLRPAAEGGQELDAVWNDDFHHSAVVALTGQREAYYTDYAGRAQELVAAAKHGYLYQGQYYSWQKKRRGSSTRGLAPHRFIAYLENHDQVANSARGVRLAQRTDPATQRALTALLLLGPWTPLLFQGQEWASARPFPYFAQHPPELATKVREGRRQQLAEFPSLASRSSQDGMPDPNSAATFAGAKLAWSSDFESQRARRSLQLHRELLQLRREDPVLMPGASGVELEATALSDTCLALRWYAQDHTDRLLIVNLATDFALQPAPEPLLAPPSGRMFRLMWSSEELRYGGPGQADDVSDAEGFRLPARSALLFEAVPREDP